MTALRWLGVAALALLFVLAGCDNGGTYQRRDGRWHFEDRPMRVADPASFQPLGRYFARDKLRGYYLGSEVADSDGSRFEALSEHEARDGRSVFWADTYRKGQEYWSIQHLRVFAIDDADPASYRGLGQGYARDARSAFFEGRAFAVRDLATFEVLDAQFTRDARRAYFEQVEIAGSDGAGFRLLGRGYARDGARVWWHGQRVAGVDLASFAVIDDAALEHDAQDARWAYRQGRRQPLAAPGSASAAR